jgi:glycosidase
MKNVWRRRHKSLCLITLLGVVLFSRLPYGAFAQAAMAAEPLRVDKVDPPEWFAGFPKPMLLLHGAGLQGTTISVSEASLHVERIQCSPNGHWLLVWLDASPASSRQIHLRIHAAQGRATLDVPYTFAARKAVSDQHHGFAGFSSRDVLYLIMQDRFADGDRNNDGEQAMSTATSADAASERAKPRGWHGGDLRGVIDHLDYIQSLGVTTVWLTPLYANHEEGSYHGYGATDLYAVDEHYGSMADVQALGDALHARDMKLVLDVVPNHVGPKNPWVTDEPTPTWFHGTAEHHLNGATDFRALIDPHASDAARDATLHGWFADILPDMNTDDATVAQYLRQNTVWWLEQAGADGLRIDTFPYVNREFWAGYTAELRQLWPHLTEVGEVFNADPVIPSSFAAGVTRAGVDTGLWTPFDFPSYFALRSVFLKHAPMTELADVLAHDALYPHPERLVPFLGNHDTTRFSADNAAAMRLAFGVLFTMRGMPQLYAGDEIAMPGGEDPDNRRDFPGGFTGLTGEDVHNAFAPTQRTPLEAAMLEWVTTLARLHTSESALACGAEQVLYSDVDTLVTVRDTAHGADCTRPQGGDGRVLVAVHRGASAKATVPLKQTWATGCEAVQPPLSGRTQGSVAQDVLQLDLAADDVWIARCQ